MVGLITSEPDRGRAYRATGRATRPLTPGHLFQAISRVPVPPAGASGAKRDKPCP